MQTITEKDARQDRLRAALARAKRQAQRDNVPVVQTELKLIVVRKVA